MGNYYYSGQGSVLVGMRDANTGRPLSLRKLGNVPELEISVETTKFEHKESESGQRAVDLTITQEINGTMSMTVENIDPPNLALFFWGTHAVVDAADVPDEAISIYELGLPIPLANAALDKDTVFVLKETAGGTDIPMENNYSIDYTYGLITPLEGGSISAGDTVYGTYRTRRHARVDALTRSSLERYLRFNGLNTIDDEPVIIDIYRASLDPLTGYGLINEELASIPVTGNILYDDKQPAASRYFRQINLNWDGRDSVTASTAINYAGATDATMNAAAGTITSPAADFVTAGFAVGNSVTFSGFTDTDNNATVTLTAVTANTLTFAAITGAADETAGITVVRA